MYVCGESSTHIQSSPCLFFKLFNYEIKNRSVASILAILSIDFLRFLVLSYLHPPLLSKIITMRRQDQQTRVFYELSALILNILRSPPSPIHFSDHSPVISVSSSRRLTAASLPQLTPAGFASLLLGVSLALMLCGSVTFFIGFLLMPWVIGLVMVFYFLGIVSSLSMLGRTILCYTMSPPSPRKDVPAWKLL